MRKKGFAVGLMVTFVVLIMLIAIFFFSDGAYAKVRRLIAGTVDDSELRGRVATDGGIVFSPSMLQDENISTKEAFKGFVKGLHPANEGKACIALMRAPEDWSFRVMNVDGTPGDEYVVDAVATSNGWNVRLLNPENIIKARFDEKARKPCIIAGTEEKKLVAKAFKACLDKNFVGCGWDVWKSVDEIKIHGKSLDKIEVPMLREEFKQAVFEYEGERVWVLFSTGVQTCFIPTGGNDEGNDKGVSEKVIEDYLKRDDKVLCTTCAFGSCLTYKSLDACRLDACKYGCTTGMFEGKESCGSCGRIASCTDYSTEDACVKDQCAQGLCAPVKDPLYKGCISCAGCGTIPVDVCVANPCSLKCAVVDQNGKQVCAPG